VADATPAPRKSLRWVKDETQYLPHQIEGVRQLARKGSFLLCDEMGLGKSLQAITVFAVDVERGWASKCLVVCPPTLKKNWRGEIDKFTTLNRMILDGSPAQRVKQLAEFSAMADPKVLIINYEQVQPHLAALNALGFDCVIYDEAHAMKNPKAARTKAAQKLRAGRHFVLTGSPMLNQVNELWSLLHRVAPAEFPSYWSFVNRYCVFGGYQNKAIIGVKNERELKARLDEFMLRRLKKDVLDLPEKQIIQIEVDLHPAQRKLYKILKEGIKDDLPDTIDPKNVDNGMVKFLRLKQLCGTTTAFIPGTDDSFKLDRVQADAFELVRDGNHVVVFTQFRPVMTNISRRMEGDGLMAYQLHGDVKSNDRQDVVAEWAAGPPAALCCMLQIATGMNMTAARHALFIDKLFVPKLNEQAQDRVHRIGASTTQPVQIREYIARGTVEQRVERILKGKIKIHDTVVETNDFKRALLEALLAESDDDD
jgi:SNF2 family DNA or RNA helicase